MRILHVSDTHLGLQRHVLGGPTGWSRADDVAVAFERALQPALRGEVDLVIHGGDLFDRSKPPRAAVVHAAATLAAVAARVPVILTYGNHDWRGLGRYLPVPGLTIADRPRRVVVGDVAVAIVPWRPSPDAWAQAARQAVGPGADLLVAHQAFDGAQVPGLTFRPGAPSDTLGAEHLPPGVRSILAGHLHPRQAFELGDATVVYPGSTERTSFSEAGQTKGTTIWTFGRTVWWRWVDVPTRPMRIVRRLDDLAAVRRGDLVRIDGDAVDPVQVVGRGGLCVVRGGRRKAQWRREEPVLFPV